MQLPEPRAEYTQPRLLLRPNRSLTTMAALFFFFGTLIGFIGDFAFGETLTLIVDAISMAGITAAAFALFARKKFSTSVILVACAGFSLFAYYGSMVVNLALYPEYTQISLDLAFLLTVVLTAATGLLVGKYVLYVMTGMCVGLTILGFVLYWGNESMMTNLGINILIVLPSNIGIVQYRGTLENFVAKLTYRLEENRKLKELAEEIQNVDKPFVIFGRNAAILIEDLSSDVKDLGARLEEIRVSRDPDTTLPLIGSMLASVDSAQQRISWVLYVTSPDLNKKEEVIDLRHALKAVSYTFEIGRGYKAGELVTVIANEELKFKGSRLTWLYLGEALLNYLFVLDPEICPVPLICSRTETGVSVSCYLHARHSARCIGCDLDICAECPEHFHARTVQEGETEDSESSIEAAQKRLYERIAELHGRIQLQLPAKEKEATLFTVHFPREVLSS